MTAKRAIWIIRAVLYPSLALAAVLLLLHRGGESEADGGPTTLYGRTAQGHYFSAGFFEGRVFRVGTFVELRCLDVVTRAGRRERVCSGRVSFSAHE